jgi:predicted nucleic acid-binding Zn ribbon protein
MHKSCKCNWFSIVSCRPGCGGMTVDGGRTVPIYVYETVPGEGKEPNQFEVRQRMSDPELTEHPETKEPVRRVIMAPALSLKHSPSREREVLSEQNLSRHGFSRYERTGKGTYERTAGKDGPKKLDPV